MSDLTGRIADLSDSSFSPDQIKKLHLLAASAGTGKTYSIQTLYLRLILIEGLTVQQILVVTFTKDATKELRDRLQHVLREALDYLEGTIAITDPGDRTKILVDVARSNPDKKTAKHRLQLALLDFDMAAIYTIHGFCQRVLNRFAFETGQPFDVEPAGDTSDEIELLCKDWWRRNVYPMDEKVTVFLSGSKEFSLKAITTLAQKLISKPDAKLFPEVAAKDNIDRKIPQVLQTFTELNPAKAEESNPYPSALAEVRDAVGKVQKHIQIFRKSVAAEKWDTALEALLTTTGLEMKIATSCLDHATALANACTAFMEKVPPSTKVKTFKFDAAGCLWSEKCVNLTPSHTAAIITAAQALNLMELVGKYTPASLYQKKAFESTLLLCRHFINNPPCTAPDLLQAIKTIAKDGAGITVQVKISVDAINPAFRQLADSLLAECGHAVCRAALDVKEQYRQGRPAATSASFDDYLVNLRNALNAETTGGGGLVKALRDEFKAALIDEFQDTDPIQWGIFEKLFKGTVIPCFLVGDPKQAIYRFRNGDVETYLKATQAIAETARYPLQKNHRSEKRLIDAVNQLFMDGNGVKTFGDGIDYLEPLDAVGKDDEKSLLHAGLVDTHPFKIVLIENSAKQLPGKNSLSARCAYRWTACEIARILKDDNLSIGGRRVSRRDIAVLVNKHIEGEYIAQELGALNIPAVRQGTGDVWMTDEGRTLWVFLEAILDTRNLSNVRRALLSPWCGLTIEKLQCLNDGKRIDGAAGERTEEYGLEDWVAVFVGLRETWLKRGFPAMFRKLTASLGLKKRLLSLNDNQGQRRLANIGQLCELVEQTILEGRKTPEGALSWVRRQFAKETADGGDEVKLRLETDDDAVRIMTIFTSKGLEFPIVFAPTLFMMKSSQRGGVYEYHDAQRDLCITRKTDNDPQSKEAKDWEKEEMQREHVRQIYVALTRAVHRTVVVALNDGDDDGKAKNKKQEYKMKGVLGEVLRLPMKMVVENQQEKIVVALEGVDARFRNVEGVQPAVKVTVADLGEVDAMMADIRAVDREPDKLKPAPDTSRGHGSFTALAPHDQKKTEESATAFGSEADSRNRDSETAGQPADQVEQKPEGIFAFPSGAKTGTCWHEIFEDLAFNADNHAIRQMVEEKLKIHGFLKNESWREMRIDVTIKMVRNVLRTLLPGLNEAKPFALSMVDEKDRKTEWEFSFAGLSGKRTSDLKAAISMHAPYLHFMEALGEWNKELPGGYLTGFVDLLFRVENRYFIADWKSNRRGGRQSDFTKSGLVEEMARHSYWLQYLIYSVAVHQFLSKALPDYDYEKHFGGVYYIFLRGVDGNNDENGNANGVYADRPPHELVEELSRILGDFL